MSSNIEVQRVCQFCGAEFTAKTTVTKYCSHRCSSLAHKQRRREQKVEATNYETLSKLNSKDSASINNKEFLTVPQTGKLMGVSRFTVYRYLQDNLLKCVKLRGKTFIRRKDLEALFDNATEYKIRKRETSIVITDFYTMKELTETFGIKETWAYKMVKEKGVPKITHRGNTLYSKPHVDKVFTKPKTERFIKEWYTTEEAMLKYNITRDSLYHVIKRNYITKTKAGRYIKIAKEELDRIFEQPIIY